MYIPKDLEPIIGLLAAKNRLSIPKFVTRAVFHLVGTANGITLRDHPPLDLVLKDG
jgi:hypothetical protein